MQSAIRITAVTAEVYRIDFCTYTFLPNLERDL